MKYVPIIPSYNPSEALITIINELIKQNFKKIIIIDDGSFDKYFFNKIAKIKECILITHDKNMGKGSALKTGFKYYQNNLIDDYLGVVTLDCDGQHKIPDVINVGNKMIESNHFVLGVREFNASNTPLRNKTGNRITSRVFKWLFKIYLKDTQTGLRAIPNKLIPLVNHSEGSKYEYEINMLIDIVKNNHPIEEVTIETIYQNKEKRHSYFSPVKDSYRIYKTMFQKIKK